MNIDNVIGSIKSFLEGTSCERDGLRIHHILNALCEEGSYIAKDLLRIITYVVNVWLGGRCSSSFVKFVAFAPLMSLLKPDNEMQPIAI